MFFQWDSFTIYHMDQAVYYALVFCALVMGISACQTVYNHHHSLVYGINEVFKLAPEAKYHRLQKLLCRQAVYGIALFGAIFFRSFFVLPFAVKFDPIQVMFGNNLSVKILASLSYGIPVINGTCLFISIITFIVSYTERLIIATVRLNEILRHGSGGKGTILISKFHKLYKTFIQIRIHFAIFAEIGYAFLTLLITIGVLLATCAGYATFKMYHMLPIYIYLGMPLVMTSSFVMAILHNTMEGILQENVNFFKKFWLGLVLKRENKKIVNSIPEIGCKLGCYGNATHLLGLKICDDIIQNLISILLISPL